MTIRDRLSKKNPSPVEQRERREVVTQPVLHCLHRAWTPDGKIKCSCSNQPEVFACDNPWMSSGFCTPTMPVQAGDGPIALPDGSKLRNAFGLNKPFRSGGWENARRDNEWTCCVYQEHYGHFSGKPTWLLVCGVHRDDLPQLAWGPCEQRLHPIVVARHGYEKARGEI